MRAKTIAALGVAAAVAVVAGFGFASSASAAVDPVQVQKVASAIEAALTATGAGASVDAQLAAINGVLGAGVDPAVADAALKLVQTWPGLSANQAVAVATADQAAEAASANAAEAGGGPGGGSPIGAPPAYVSGGGSDYVSNP